ncbi:MAG: TonB-dependent receptor [bacterium]
MRKRFDHALHICGFAACLIGWPLSLLAADSVRYYFPEQTITATRAERSWLETPTALTVLRAESEPVQRGLGVCEPLLLVPGLVAQSRFGTDDIRLSVRGLGARSNSGVRGVRILYDGIPESEPDGQTRLEGIEVGNLDQVEVLRGAGSPLYGNAAGGVVNFRTAEFFPRPGITLQGLAGSYGFRKLKLSLGTGPGGEGGVVSLSATHVDGWREHSQFDGQTISGGYTMSSSPLGGLRALFYFTNVAAALPGPLTPEQFAEDPFQANANYVKYDVYRYTRKGRLGIRYSRLLAGNFGLEFTPYAALKKLDRPSDKAEYKLITRYVLGGAAQFRWQTHLGHRALELIGGFDEQYQDGPSSTYENIAGARGDSLLSQWQLGQWGQGAFVQADWHLSQKWRAAIGGRFDWLRFQSENLLSLGGKEENTQRGFSPKVGLRYLFAPATMIYGNFSGGFETPAHNEMDDNSVLRARGYDVELDPQRTLTFELGIRRDGKLRGMDARFELTGYRMIVRDIIVPDTLAGENYFRNAAEALHQGVECFGRLARARWGWTALSLSLARYEFSDYTVSGADYTGKQIVGVPSVTAGFVAHAAPSRWFFVELSTQGAGEAFANSDNTTKAARWLVLSGSVGGELPWSGAAVRWHVAMNNITDRRYVSFIQANDSKRRYFEMGMPRTLTAGLQIGTPGL